MADPVKNETPYVPPSQVKVEDLAAAFEESGVIPPREPAAPAQTGNAAPPAPPTPPADDVPALVKIARERDAARKKGEIAELEQAKPYISALKVLSPTEAEALARAKQAGDPIAAMNALGFTHQQYTSRLLGMESRAAEPQKTEEKQPAGDPDVRTLKEEVARLKAEREAEQFQQGRKQALGQMETLLKNDPKFKHIATLGDYEGVERVLLRYYNDYKELPGSTFEESIKLAAEVHEADLKKEAARWEKVLTGFKTSASTPVQKAPESPPSTGSETPRTLTNADGTEPGAQRPASSKSRQEFIARFIEQGEAALGE